VEALTDAAPDLRRIGVELGQEQRMGIPVGAYLELVEALSGVEFVDAAEIVISVRMVKAPEEVAYMRQAAEITGRARQRLFDRVVPGMTERDVARLTRQLIMEEGGDRTSFVHLQSDLPGSSNIFSYDRPLQKGTVLAVDTGAYVGMYTVDYARMATLGPTTDEQRRVHAAALEVNQKMMDVLRPGVTCSEVYHVAVRAIEEAGVTVDTPLRLQGSRMGHGQGMLLTEPPSIAAADHTVLQPGMVISTEPGVRSGDVQILWEDVHLITEDGYEKITLETPELREIPF
jgi:Xaa-Pro aminopeptidase